MIVFVVVVLVVVGVIIVVVRRIAEWLRNLGAECGTESKTIFAALRWIGDRLVIRI